MTSGWPRHYILVGRTPVAVDLMTWAVAMNDRGNRIASTQLTRKCWVSTIFLGLDHNFSGGEPILFETMIFGGPLDGEQWRYHTYDEAKRGHVEAVAAARIAYAKVKSIADTAGATEK